jgi:hypothetical protein
MGEIPDHRHGHTASWGPGSDEGGRSEQDWDLAFKHGQTGVQTGTAESKLNPRSALKGKVIARSPRSTGRQLGHSQKSAESIQKP